MRVTSSSAGPRSFIPTDLRIRLPQIQGRHIEQAVVVLPQEPGDGKLNHCRRAGMRQSEGRELDLRPERLQLTAVPERTVAHEEDLLSGGLELPDQLVRGAH